LRHRRALTTVPCSQTLLAVMFRDSEMGTKLVGAGLITAILEGLGAHPADRLVFRSSCMLLRELCREEDHQRILREEGIPAVVRTLPRPGTRSPYAPPRC